ncbi:hypothetical protein [Neolewinella persica]|uniref:hypothetical protein n=1 Tax=Neolewinella persica TaxID=70998 RepID=UPI000374D3A0|nr:hypothetical protein [Neolewinella persica]
MKLQIISRSILFLAVLLLVLTGFFPSPTMIALTATASSVLVLWQAYAILRDDSGLTPYDKLSKYDGYLRK